MTDMSGEQSNRQVSVAPGGTLWERLPALYRADLVTKAFIGCFEEILTGLPAGSKAIAAELDWISNLHDPQVTPSDFLPWLAEWIGVALRTDIEEAIQRKLIARAVPLYAWRGTKKGICETVELMTECKTEIEEPQASGLRLGVEAIVGHSTRLGQDFPHFFRVFVYPDGKKGSDWVEKLARDVVDRLKPAHTYYSLQIVTQTSTKTIGTRADTAKKT